MKNVGFDFRAQNVISCPTVRIEISLKNIIHLWLHCVSSFVFLENIGLILKTYLATKILIFMCKIKISLIFENRISRSLGAFFYRAPKQKSGRVSDVWRPGVHASFKDCC